ncbi:tetratricopeptide repeat (TPR)-containing protein [Rhynchospora pubera]|uniref:Tetratricopeptide repeat (TPR)-containing protein n=1 Tax=Rhynchospora pubera TaxID=906938 RepID=A0AAV8F9E1_9POAL|nr:tetratricopeptide repeat (TPR)-containing protein [Rhynchospora pubera]
MASSRASDERKATKLLEAASSGNLRVLKEVVKELNENQIKRIRNEIGLSALHLAAFHGRTEICQYFVQDLAFPVDFLTPLGETPLSQAAMCGHVATARYLISQGANTVAPNGEGSTPLHYAARYGQDELVKYLLSLGVPVDVTCNSAVGAPLITAALFGQASIVEVLLQHHADPNGASTDYTPLLTSIHAGSLECTKLLIKAGADLNLKCPLDMAIDKGLNDIIKCLLEAGADPNVRNAYEWLPIERAVMFSKWDIVEMLFPLTSPVPEVHDWSVHGILQYVQSNAFMEKYDAIQKKDLADLKVKGADSFKKKEYLNAFSYYSKAIKIDSGDAALFSNLSLCSYRMGDGEMALSDALMALRLRPRWPKAYYRIGAAYMLLEEHEKASQAFMDGLLLDPNNIEIKRAYWEAVDCSRRSHFAETSE